MKYDFLTLRHIRWSKNMYFWQNTFCSKNSNKIETFEELVLTRMFDWFEHLFLLSWQPLSRRNNWISKVEPLWNSPRLSLVHPCFSSTIELGLLVAMTLALWTAFSWTLGELRERKYQKLGLLISVSNVQYVRYGHPSDTLSLQAKKQRTKQPLTIPFYFMKSPSLKPKNVVTNSGFQVFFMD